MGTCCEQTQWIVIGRCLVHLTLCVMSRVCVTTLKTHGQSFRESCDRQRTTDSRNKKQLLVHEACYNFSAPPSVIKTFMHENPTTLNLTSAAQKSSESIPKPCAQLTVCLMLKMADEGKVKTRLAAGIGSGEACAVYQKLVEHQIEQLRGCEVEIHFSPPSARPRMVSWLGEAHRYFEQVDGDLGMRFDHAVGNFFNRGGQAMMLLGGDCPDVTRAVLNSVSHRLELHDVVIGPALDGGYYLLAMKKHHRRLFEEIEWSTARVFRQTMDRVQELGLSCHVLPELADVDDIASLTQARLTHAFLR